MSSYIKKALQTSIIHIERFKEFGPNRNTIIGPAKLEIPDFPHQKTVWSRPSLLFNNSGELMYCGDEICWVLKDNEWKFHSEFLKARHNKVMVQMSNGTYVFGYTYGDSENSSEFLPNKSCKWQAGPSIPYDKRVSMYSALAVSKNEFVLIGGSTTLSNIGTILKFNIITSKWTVVGNLKHPRSECLVAVFNDKITRWGAEIFTLIFLQFSWNWEEASKSFFTPIETTFVSFNLRYFYLTQVNWY